MYSCYNKIEPSSNYHDRLFDSLYDFKNNNDLILYNMGKDEDSVVFDYVDKNNADLKIKIRCIKDITNNYIGMSVNTTDLKIFSDYYNDLKFSLDENKLKFKVD